VTPRLPVIAPRSRKLTSAGAISVGKQRHGGDAKKKSMHGSRRSLLNRRLVKRRSGKKRHRSAGSRIEWRQRGDANRTCTRKRLNVGGIKDRRLNLSGKLIKKMKDAVTVVVQRHDLVTNTVLDVPTNEHPNGLPHHQSLPNSETRWQHLVFHLVPWCRS